MAADINFYGLLYEFHRTSTNGADILITIEKKWYEGEVKQRALGRAPVIKRENKDHIFGTSCELYAECLVDGEYADMYTSDPYEFRVSVYKDETLLWQGFVSPELYSEPDAAPPYDVQITATDGLGELKNSIYKERGAASILSHIMGLIGQYPIYVISGLRYVDSTGAISQDHDILNVRINLDHEKGNSKYDVLQNLLTSLNANITQLNGRYVIFRETDFINKATDEGVEAFDVNGEKVYISIASFGSMTSHQWWPIGQLSTVVEPAKNSLVLQAPNHYKDNVLDFSQWSVLNSAEYDATEDAYILPDEGSYITQALDFDNEVGYRLGLRIRARNVGDSEEDQNIGLMIKVNARTYAAPEGRDFWLVKSEVSTGNARTDYLWRGQEDYFEEALNMPSDADTASDAQNVDIVIPLYDHSQNGLSYIFASSLSIKIFNPAGIHDIYVYDVSLVKYEQSEGYEAKVVINNAAREAESDIDLSMSSASFAPAAGNMFMTGLPMQADGLLIEQWQIPGSAAQEYLSAMSYDYARAVALPKMKYSGVLNVPDTATILPILFLRDGTYYFPKTYTYDLYNDEIQVELISISAADVSLSSVVISQYAESSGNMGGVTTGGGGGGSVISLPRDKVMSDTSDNAVENKVIKKYVDDLRDQLLDLWHLDENGNIVTDKQVLIKNNLIVEKDTSSGGEGEDTPSAGLNEEQLQQYLDEHKYVTEDDIAGLIPDVDLSNYYTKPQTDSAISTAIAAIDLSIYAKSEDVYTKTQIDEIEEGIDTALATKAKQSDLVTLQGEVDNIETVLGLSETAEGYINTWAEVVAFLDGYKNADDLATILSGINADIAKNAEDIATLDNDKADKTTVTALAERVTTAEDAIDDNAGNIKKNFDAIGALGKRVTAEEAVTTTYASWWADLKKWVTVEGDNVKISTNLIVTGDTSSGGSGSDTPASGTVTGIKVNGVTYEPTAGIVTIPDYPTSLTWSAISGKPSFATVATSGKYSDLSGLPTIPTVPTKVSAFTNDIGYITGITQSMIGTALGSANNGGKVLISTGGGLGWASMPTSLPASDVYAWAKKPSLALADVPDLSSKYLPLTGGVISGSNFSPLHIKSSSASYAGLGLRLSGSTYSAYLLYKGDTTWAVTGENWVGEKTLLHSGNYSTQIGDYYLKSSGGILRDSWSGGTEIRRVDNTNGYAKLTFSQADGTILGALGFGGVDNPLFITSSGGYNTLIHSGNIGSYALKTDGSNKMSAAIRWNDGHEGNDVSDWDTVATETGLRIISAITTTSHAPTTYATALHVKGRYGFQLASEGGESDNFWIRNVRNKREWKKLAFTDSNVASATKLQTARTIWGQSFDGTGKVDGLLTIGYGATTNSISNSIGLHLNRTGASSIASAGIALTNEGVGALLLGGNGGCLDIYTYDGTTASKRMLINSSGNVTIGASDLAGTSNNKLWVNGNTRVAGDFVLNPAQSVLFTFGVNTSRGAIQAMHDGVAFLPILLNPNGGNIGIGTTGPQYKLDVAGTGRFTGAVTMSNELFLGNNMGIYFKNASGTNALAMYVSPSNVLQVGYNNVDSVAFQKPVTMSSTLSVADVATFSNGLVSASSIIADANILSKGNLILNTSATSYSTGGVINFGIYGKALTSDFSTSFKTSMFGNADNGAKFRVARTNVTISNLCEIYGNALAWASNDTNGYLAVNYSNANPGAFIGGGNGDKLNWYATLFHNKMNLVPNATNSYTLGTSSYQWSTIYGVNGIFSGDTSSGSDIRFKDIIKNKTLKIEHIAKAPLFTFRWNDRDDDTIHLGSSAQYWEKVCPWLVTGEDFKSLNYATLGVAMGISLAKKAVNHEERIKVLEKENKALKEEIRRMQYGS